MTWDKNGSLNRKTEFPQSTHCPKWRKWEICRMIKVAKRWESIRALVRSMLSWSSSNVGRSHSQRPGFHPLKHFKARWPNKSLEEKIHQFWLEKYHESKTKFRMPISSSLTEMIYVTWMKTSYLQYTGVYVLYQFRIPESQKMTSRT